MPPAPWDLRLSGLQATSPSSPLPTPHSPIPPPLQEGCFCQRHILSSLYHWAGHRRIICSHLKENCHSPTAQAHGARLRTILGGFQSIGKLKFNDNHRENLVLCCPGRPAMSDGTGQAGIGQGKQFWGTVQDTGVNMVK